MDNIDKKNLFILQRNADLPISEISERWDYHLLLAGIELKT